MKTIIIDSLKYGKKGVLVDDSDYDELIKLHWCIAKMPKTFYAVSYLRVNGYEKNIYMHRHILGLTDKKDWCDHKDHNGLNNQRNNLRKCSNSQNKQNKTSHGKSKYLGVCHVERTIIRGSKTYYYNCYQAAINVNGKQLQLGTFKKEQEAAIARDNAAKKYHGEFANLNFKK